MNGNLDASLRCSTVAQYMKEIIPKIRKGQRRQKEGTVAYHQKAVGSNPMHFGLRIQQLVQ